MTQKKSRTQIASAVSLALSSMMLSAGLSAGEIQNIDLANFGDYDPAQGEFVTIFDRAATDPLAASNGQISWDILKAKTPGIIVFNNTPAYNQNQLITDCVMAPRIDALLDPVLQNGVIVDYIDRQCNDGFQSHKRYKMNATAIGPIDVVFKVKNVDNVVQILDKDGNPLAQDQDTARNIYRMIGKLNNHTLDVMGGFTVQVGVGLGDTFKKSPMGDGLKIGLVEEGGDPATALGDNDMAEFPGGLFYGPADEKHGIGFFDDARAGFAVTTAALATDEDYFGSMAVSTNYSSKFGKWLPIDGVPNGWFYDFDGNPATDATLVAWDSGTDVTTWTDDANWQRGFLDGFAAVDPTTEGWVNNTATVWDDDGDLPNQTDANGDPIPQTLGGTLYATWNPVTELYDLAAGGTMTNDEMTIAIAESTTLERRPGYVKGPIEDLANLNLNYFIEVADISRLPTYNSADRSATITLRITSVDGVAVTLPPPAEEYELLPAPTATTSGGGGGCAVGGNGRFDPTLPALLAMGLGFFGWRRFKAGK